MKGETHALMGAAVAVTVANPTTFSGLIFTAVTGALGGLYCDIDSKKSLGKRFFDKLISCSIFAIFCTVFAVANFMPDLYNKLEADQSLMIRMMCLIGLAAFTIVGMKSPHRMVTHSVEFTGAIAGMLYFINPDIAYCFWLGMISHIMLDLLNRKKVRLSIIFNIDICLGICYSDGFVSKVLSLFGAVVIVCHQGGILLERIKF